MHCTTRFARPASAAALAALIALSLSTTGCEKSPGTPSTAGGTPAAATPSAAAPAVALPDGLVTRGPAQGTPVTAAKASAQQGQEVVVVGRIGGSVNPFVADRAVFTIVDPALMSCADMDDPDHCKTPWDYCCEERTKMRAGTATIEVTGADGKPLALPLRGVQGLDPLATIAVTGTVTERNDAGLLVIRAKRIEVRDASQPPAQGG